MAPSDCSWGLPIPGTMLTSWLCALGPLSCVPFPFGTLASSQAIIWFPIWAP